MKNLKSVLLTLSLVVSGVCLSSCATSEAASGDYVYICTGPNAKVYHSSKNCRGLRKCSGEVKHVARQSVKRRACKVCCR